MPALAPTMPTPKKSEFAEYDSVKLDNEVHPFARAAAAILGISTQEFISNAVNEAAAKVLNRTPVKRRPPKPKKRAGE